MKKMLPALVATLFASSFVFAQEKPFKEPISGVESTTDPQAAESVHRQADAIRTKNEQVAKSHKKAKRDPDARKARQKQADGRRLKKESVANAHQEARDARAYADEARQSAREAEKSAEYAREKANELKK